MQRFLTARRMGKSTASKIVINEDTALKISAVFCSVRILSGLMATMPIDVYERKGAGLSDAKVSSHPLAELLGTRPNSYQVPAVFEEQRQAHLSLWGNAYSELIFSRRGAEVISAINHHPYNVEPFWDDQNRAYDGLPRLCYRIAGKELTIDASQMNHVPGFGFNGIEGLSTLSAGAESFGLAASNDNLVAQFNGNAAKPFLIITHPGVLDEGPYNRLARDVREEYSGENSYGTLILEEGMEANPLTIPFKDLQHLESRKFQGEEITSRWFGLPPHLAGYLDNAHYDNIEEQDRALLVFTLAPMILRREQEWNRKGFSPAQQGRFYVKYNVDGLLRAQQKERYEAFKSAIQAGWKTVNEIRKLEDLPPIAGGDELPRPANIWGKPDGAAPGVAKDQREFQRQIEERTDAVPVPAPQIDHRLAALTLDVIQSLQQAEKIHAERAARHPDAAIRIREWYEGHELKALDKLKGLQPEARAVLAHYREHREQLLRAVSDADPFRAVEACIAGWSDDPQRLAKLLAT